MKLLIITLSMIISVTALARDKDDRKQDRAQRLFNTMSAEEALASNKFTKRGWNINLPGTSTWYSPNSLCLTATTMETVSPREICTEWTVDLKDREFGRDHVVFDSRHKAMRKADSSNAKGQPYCTDSYSKIMKAPRAGMVEKCTLWGVKMDNSSKVKTFKYRSRATDYAENSSKARGNAFCVEEGLVKRVVPTTYKVDFYRRTTSDRYDRKKFLGRHVYPIQMCN